MYLIEKDYKQYTNELCIVDEIKHKYNTKESFKNNTFTIYNFIFEQIYCSTNKIKISLLY